MIQVEADDNYSFSIIICANHADELCDFGRLCKKNLEANSPNYSYFALFPIHDRVNWQFFLQKFFIVQAIFLIFRNYSFYLGTIFCCCNIHNLLDNILDQ